MVVKVIYVTMMVVKATYVIIVVKATCEDGGEGDTSDGSGDVQDDDVLTMAVTVYEMVAAVIKK